MQSQSSRCSSSLKTLSAIFLKQSNEFFNMYMQSRFNSTAIALKPKYFENKTKYSKGGGFEFEFVVV